MTKALFEKAALAFDQKQADAGLLCLKAKAKAGSAASFIANEAIQLHGGIGVTDEYDAGLYLKQIATSEKIFGDYDFLLNQIAKKSGF